VVTVSTDSVLFLQILTIPQVCNDANELHMDGILLGSWKMYVDLFIGSPVSLNSRILQAMLTPYWRRWVTSLPRTYLTLTFRMPNSLNSREHLRKKSVTPDGTFLQLSPISQVQSPGSSADARRGVKSLSVHIQTVSKTDYGYPAPSYSAPDLVSVFSGVFDRELISKY